MEAGLKPGCLTREVVGESAQSLGDAIRAALEAAAAEGGSWFEVREIRGVMSPEGPVFQVRLAVGVMMS
jgi:flavin-binding protein dodecin